MPFVDYDRVLEHSDIVFSEEEVQAAYAAMGAAITADFKDKDPVVLTVMMGGFHTAAGLAKHLKFALEQDYIHASSYGNKTTGGELEIIARPHISLVGRDVLLVDDILDRGITLAQLIEIVKGLGAKSVRTAVLIDKIPGHVVGGLTRADYTGLTLHKKLFLIGCGLDCNKRMRELPAVYALREGFEFTPERAVIEPASATGAAANPATLSATAAVATEVLETPVPTPGILRGLVLHAASVAGTSDTTQTAAADETRRASPRSATL